MKKTDKRESKEMQAIKSERRCIKLYLDICKLCDVHMDNKDKDGSISKFEVREVFAKLLYDEMCKDSAIK